MQIQRKTIVLLVTLFVMTATVVFIAVRMNQQPGVQESPEEDSIVQVLEKEKTALLSFEEQSIEVDPFSDDPIEVFVTVDGQDRQMSGVQIEAVYDPRILSNVSINPVFPSLFGETDADTIILDNEVNPEDGSIVFIQGVTLQNTTPRTGKGRVAVLSFRINPTSSADKTTISLLPTSMVTEIGTTGSILKTAESLDIIITRE